MTYAPLSRFAVGLSGLALLAASCAGGSSTTGTGGSGGSASATGGSGPGTGGNSSGTGGSVGTGGANTGGTGTGGSVSTGGTPGTGGSISTGGTTGTGGLPGTGGAVSTGGSGAGGSGGAGAKGGAGGGAAGATGKGGAGGGTTACSSLPLCDDFESSTVGAAPNSALWTIVNDGTGAAPSIDSMGAHGSSKSVKIVGASARVYIRNSTVIGTLGTVVHARYYVRFGTALPQGHTAFMVTHPTTDFSESNELRLGTQFSQDLVFHWNVASDAANLPTIYNGDPESFAPAINTWYCVEATINTSNGHLNVSVDGNDIAGLTDDGVATTNIDADWINAGTAVTKFYNALADFNVGWRNFGGGNAMTVWYDDVALSPSPIGCAQ